MSSRHFLLRGGIIAGLLLASACSADAPNDPDLVIRSGSGTFAFTPPEDAAAGWWASFSFHLCLREGASAEPVVLESAELDEVIAPDEARISVITYTRPSEGDQTFTAIGLPRQVSVDGEPMITWDGDRPVAGTVRPVNGAPVVSRCRDKGTEAGQEHIVVSLRTDTAGANVAAVRLTYRQGDRRLTTAPSTWDMIACGDAVRAWEGGARWCTAPGQPPG